MRVSAQLVSQPSRQACASSRLSKRFPWSARWACPTPDSTFPTCYWTDLIPCFGTKLSMISAEERGRSMSKSRHTEAHRIGAQQLGYRTPKEFATALRAADVNFFFCKQVGVLPSQVGMLVSFIDYRMLGSLPTCGSAAG